MSLTERGSKRSNPRSTSSYLPTKALVKPEEKRPRSGYKPSEDGATVGDSPKGSPQLKKPPTILPRPPTQASLTKSFSPRSKTLKGSVDATLSIPEIPPRSPPLTPRISDLPTIPDRPPTEEEDKAKKQADMRQNCLNEIYQTEKDYILDLELLINVFIFPLRAMNALPEAMLYHIFSNVEVLINCNKEMLKELETEMAGKKGADVKIGGAFAKLADYFKMYKVYSANQQTSLSTVDIQMKKNPQFKKNLDVCHSDPRCKGLFLQSFLIKPIQRVCKYPLLLRELIRYTPEDHVDYKDLQTAFSKINEVVANINEGQRQAEGLQRVIDLGRLIDGVDTLIAPNRNLHKEGDLHFYKSVKSKHSEKRHVFFFTDMIMLTTKKGDKKFEHKLSISLDNCRITVLADSSHMKNSFELLQSKNRCVLGCDTPNEAKEWTREIKLLIKEYQKRKIRELKEMKEKGLVPINQMNIISHT